MRDPSLPSATAGPTVIPTAMVSVAVIDKLRTSVILIGYRPISTERGANTACKSLCASVRVRVPCRASVTASLMAHIQACHCTESCMVISDNDRYMREVMV